jgi:alanine racemase
MKDLLTKLSRRRFPYEPLITIEISRSRLIHNLNEFRKLTPIRQPVEEFAPGGAVAPVLKSNAYGHGLLEVAQALKHEDVSFFVVDSYFEAIALRSGGFKPALLIIGYTRPETIARSRLKNVAFTITGMETLEKLPKENRRAMHIHLKIDTGMRRQGIMPEEIDHAIEIIKGNNSIILEGLCSHLCDADDADESFTESQIHVWNRAAKKFRDTFPSLRYWHLAATDGHYFGHDIDANVSRLGIGLYGLSENSVLTAKLDLQPVLEMKTIVTGVKQLKEGETVGYDRTFKATTNMTIATVPVGYFEGVDRRLSSGPDASKIGQIQVGPNRTPCPIVGRVSMNITSVDISKVAGHGDTVGIKIGDTAVVISNNAADPNSIVSMAQKCRTISYEIAVKIPEHLKRVVVE